MSEINRSLLVVKPKQPFLDWAHSWDRARYTLDDIREDSTAYLIPEYELNDEQMVILEYCHGFIFEEELFSWCIDEATWPEQRDLKTFLEWFDLEFHSLVFDLAVGTPLEYVDYGQDEVMTTN
ncbi:MAG: hypothetical protein ACR2LM_11785 [Pyrinomonadaceae bacterium]